MQQVPSVHDQRSIESRFKIMGINIPDAQGNVGLTLSETLLKCTEMQDQGIIKEFTLTRTTMGEVFTDFAKFQIDGAAKGYEDGE